MTKLMFTFSFLIASSVAFAQPPLSKRDQKKLAAWEKELEAEKNYEATITSAEAAFEEGRFVDARMLYQEAIQYNEERKSWLVAKVNDLDILLARNAARQIDTIRGITAKGVRRIEMDDTGDGSIAIREMSLELAPVSKGEPEPAEEIEVEKPVKVEEPAVEKDPPLEIKPKPEVVVQPKAKPAEPARKVQPVAKVEPATPAKEEKGDPYEDFPRGITEDLFTFPDHEVTRIVVKDGIDTMVYKKVKHRWGGEFCFKDDISISKRIWSEQVEEYRKIFDTQGRQE